MQRLSVILKGHLMQCFDSSQSSELISRLRRQSSRNILTSWMRTIRRMSDCVSKQETLCRHAKTSVWNMLLCNRLLLCFSVITVTTLQNQLRNLEREQRNDKTPSLTVTRKCSSVFCDRWIHIRNVWWREVNWTFLELTEQLKAKNEEHSRDQALIKSKLWTPGLGVLQYFGYYGWGGLFTRIFSKTEGRALMTWLLPFIQQSCKAN